VTIVASCQACGGTGDRRHWVVHRPGCTLSLAAVDCREAGELTRPCRYLGHCNVERRGIQVQTGMRGELCVWFELHRKRLGPDPDGSAERAAIQGESAP